VPRLPVPFRAGPGQYGPARPALRDKRPAGPRLDYYSRTVFEYVSASLGAQDSLGGGGRYDYLVEEFGGRTRPASAWRSVWSGRCFAAPAPPVPERRHLVFVVWLTEAEVGAAEKLADQLRADGMQRRSTTMPARSRAVQVSRCGPAACCIVIGPDELAKGVYSLKDLASGRSAKCLRPPSSQKSGRCLQARSLGAEESRIPVPGPARSLESWNLESWNPSALFRRCERVFGELKVAARVDHCHRHSPATARRIG